LAQAISLPPLPEQHRIVAEIEKHFTRLDAAVASLQRAKANLKRYRASVLKAACQGKLVPTEAELARAEGREYEPASVLLERILKDRRARWEAQERRRGKYKEPATLDISTLPGVPEGWVWAMVEQLAWRI
jgi:type I restriction enzyme S subunit